jgi:hypothetical protein
MMDVCQATDCKTPIPYSGKGRPKKFCPEHAKARTARSKRNWKEQNGKGTTAKERQALEAEERWKHDWLTMRPHCRDYRAADPKGFARSRRRRCPQCQTWRAMGHAFKKGTPKATSELEMIGQHLANGDLSATGRTYTISSKPSGLPTKQTPFKPSKAETPVESDDWDTDPDERKGPKGPKNRWQTIQSDAA